MGSTRTGASGAKDDRTGLAGRLRALHEGDVSSSGSSVVRAATLAHLVGTVKEPSNCGSGLRVLAG